MAAAFVLCSTAATFVDVIGGRASIAQELVHAPEVAGLLLLVLLVRPWHRTVGRAPHPVPA